MRTNARQCICLCRAGRCFVVRGWDLQDARGVEVATYADLYGKCDTADLQLDERQRQLTIAYISD